MTENTVVRPIIVFGCPRSGTTLLRVMLNAHPRIAIPPETRFMIPAYARRLQFGDLRSARARRRLVRFVVDRPDSKFRRFRLDVEQARSDMVAAGPALGDIFAVPFQGYAARFDKPRWGDKRPVYYSFLDELARLFPDAQFVHVVRDGRACVASLKRPPFSYPSGAAMATWLNAMSSARDAGRRLGPDRVFQLRYEDLVGDPERELRRLCDWLGEDYAEAMTAPEEIVDEVVPSGFQQHAQISAGVNAGSVDRWRGELSLDEIGAFEAVARPLLAEHGYEPVGVQARGRVRRAAFKVRLRHRRYRLRLAAWRFIDRAMSPGPLGRRLPRRARSGLARWHLRRRLLLLEHRAPVDDS